MHVTLYVLETARALLSVQRLTHISLGSFPQPAELTRFRPYPRKFSCHFVFLPATIFPTGGFCCLSLSSAVSTPCAHLLAIRYMVGSRTTTLHRCTLTECPVAGGLKIVHLFGNYIDCAMPFYADIAVGFLKRFGGVE